MCIIELGINLNSGYMVDGSFLDTICFLSQLMSFYSINSLQLHLVHYLNDRFTGY